MGPKRDIFGEIAAEVRKTRYEVIGNIPYGKKLWLYVQ